MRKLTVWPQQRLWTAGAALGAATLTGVAGVGACLFTDQATLGWMLAGGHVLVTLWAAAAEPRLLALQVAIGAALAATPLLDTDISTLELSPLALVVAGTVATAELLGAAARMGLVVDRDPGPDLARVAIATALALVASGATLAIGTLPGPSGLAAVALGALSCVGVAVLLLRPATTD